MRAADDSARDAEESAAPQSPQNLKGGPFSLPHLGQRCENWVPHSPQNFLSGGLSCPHFEQRIGLPQMAKWCSNARWSALCCRLNEPVADRGLVSWKRCDKREFE